MYPRSLEHSYEMADTNVLMILRVISLNLGLPP